jgi:hypothetical protein
MVAQDRPDNERVACVDVEAEWLSLKMDIGSPRTMPESTGLTER